MRRIALKISYDGSKYSGWQRQPDKLTFQEVVELAIEKATSEKVKLVGSGRTDAGVHALGQIAHFDTNSSISAEKFYKAINFYLVEEEIRVLESYQVASDFDACRSAKKKTYRYNLYLSDVEFPLIDKYASMTYKNLSVEKLKECPRCKDVFEVMRRWEDARERKLLSSEEIAMLKRPGKEHIMLINEKGEYELCEYTQLKSFANGDENARAFTFTRCGKSYAVIWHTRGEGELLLPLSSDEFTYEDELGKDIIASKNENGGSVIPISKRRYISCEMSVSELEAALTKARLV